MSGATGMLQQLEAPLILTLSHGFQRRAFGGVSKGAEPLWPFFPPEPPNGTAGIPLIPPGGGVAGDVDQGVAHG
jgi:hypothetical protein